MDRGGQPTDSVNEADPIDGSTLPPGRFADHESHEVVNQGVHHQLLVYASDALAVQHVHAQGVFEMTKVRFDAPTLAVEPSDVRFGITFRVEQRGRQGDDAGAAAALGDHETKFAHHQRV